MVTTYFTRKEKKTMRSLYLAGLVSFILGAVVDDMIQPAFRESARYLAMQSYEPIGNGGAIAAAGGYTSPRRQEMLDNVKGIHRQKLMMRSYDSLDSNPYVVIGEARKLKLEKTLGNP